MTSITISIENCPRCAGDHGRLTEQPLTRPMAPYVPTGGEPTFTHWALCPANGEPILVAYPALVAKKE